MIVFSELLKSFINEKNISVKKLAEEQLVPKYGSRTLIYLGDIIVISSLGRRFLQESRSDGSGRSGQERPSLRRSEI